MNPELVMEGMTPYFLHIVPVDHDAIFQWMANSEDTGHRLRLISDTCILTCADWIKAFADYAGENYPWGIITIKTSVYESITVINDYCLFCHVVSIAHE